MARSSPNRNDFAAFNSSAAVFICISAVAASVVVTRKTTNKDSVRTAMACKLANGYRAEKLFP